jgi:diguanylate cyclase (GGDEF)-like protein
MAEVPSPSFESVGARAELVDGVGLKRHWAWIAVAALLVVGGSLGSVLGGLVITQNALQNSHKAFAASSVDIASTLQLAIQHEQDLIVSAGGFVAEDPTASNSQFVDWASAVHALARYPELVGIGHSVIVPAAALASFARTAVIDPTGPLAANGRFEVVPPGARPYYCLSVGAISRSVQGSFPAGYDFCAVNPLKSASLNALDSGNGSYIPVTNGKLTLLSVLTPIYRGGITPATVAGRRQAFLGWVGMSVLPQLVLNRALQSHPGTAVRFEYRADSSRATFQTAGIVPDADSVTINLHNGWTVETFRAVAGGGVLGDGNALLLLIGGVVLSVLLAGFVLMLGTSRSRALRLVWERTGELRHQALHDSLTGLPNRALIMDRIEQLLARGRRYGTVGAALYVDIDDFKNVNDSLGHEAGDQLLVSVASRMQGTLRDADTIGRMGGDEFVVLIEGGDPRVAPELVAKRILDVMRQPFELTGASIPVAVNTSIGIAVGDRGSGGKLLRDADVALYQAKADGKGCYAFFRPEMQSLIGRRIGLEFDLRSALAGEQFRLVYQAIYNLEDLTIVGVEALLRWDHPIEGVIQPDEFIPILEQTGQIREIGRWVLLQACHQMAAWHDRGDTLDVSVNVSARQLDDDSIIGHIEDALSVSRLDPASLIIEVTETALMRDANSAVRRLRAIKDLGVRIAVDDFGTGYSSLVYLQQFPVDCIKIDKSFTNAMTSSPESKALIRTLVQLGRDLGLKTLAEGVETTDEMDLLRADHVDEAQGFLLARPLDPDTLEAQLLAPMRPAGGVPRQRRD